MNPTNATVQAVSPSSAGDSSHIFSSPPSDFDGFMEVIAREAKNDPNEQPHFTQKIDIVPVNSSSTVSPPFSIPSPLPLTPEALPSLPMTTPSMSPSTTLPSISAPLSTVSSPYLGPDSSLSSTIISQPPSLPNSSGSSLFSNLIKPDWENEQLPQDIRNDTALKELNEKIDRVTKILENLMKNEKNEPIKPIPIPNPDTLPPEISKTLSNNDPSATAVLPSPFSFLSSTGSSAKSFAKKKINNKYHKVSGFLSFSGVNQDDDFDSRLESLRKRIQEEP
jgi:hypothetical protein